jgi:hypothetical protein
VRWPISSRGADVADEGDTGGYAPHRRNDPTTPAYDPYLIDGAASGQPPGVIGRSLPILIAAAVGALVLIGISAYVAARLWSPGADPAERLPDSAIFYADVDLYPGSGGSAMVGHLLNQLGLDEGADVWESDIADLLAFLGADDIDPADVTRWIGARGAIAVYNDVGAGNDAATVAVAIASRNDHAARDNLAAILDVSTEEFGYVVDDGLVVLTIADRDPQARAEEIAAAGRAAPMAGHESFQSGLERLGGDYSATVWIDTPEALAFDLGGMAEDDVRTDADLGIPRGADFLDFSTVFGTDPIVIGVQAINGGVEAHFLAEERDSTSGRTDWLDRLGEVASAEIVVVLTLPDDLGEPSAELVQFLDDIYNSPLPFLDDYERGMWDYGLALSDDELDEYNDLNRQLAMGALTEDDPDFDRLIELEDAYWTFGLQSKYDQAARRGSLESYFSIPALNDDEYYELLRIESQWDTFAVNFSDKQWYDRASRRLYAYGVERDYPWYEPDVDTKDVAALLLDYLSGITITATVDDLFGEPRVGLAAEVADGRADRLYRLPRRVRQDLFDFLAAEPRFDDARVVFGELSDADRTLSDHPQFADAFDGTPTEAVLAMFIDLRAINAGASDHGDEPDDFSVVSLVYGTDGTGVIRLLY